MGLALLQHTFRHFWQAGQPNVGLHVDGLSLTGATRLYERAGMRIEKEYTRFEKELRPGEELARVALDEA
ncbi:MAG: hypothetical protein HC915_18660 [Anaerolineae bacterium]|nr:hypothetical protein [Anaerolineae bacterium]